MGAVAAAEEGGEPAGAEFGWVWGGLGFFGTFGFPVGFVLGALLTPVAPAVMPGDEVDPASLDGFSDGPEADRGGKVQSRGGQHAGHQPCALDVEVGDQQTGHEPAHHALGREHMEPTPVPGQQPKDGRDEEDG